MSCCSNGCNNSMIDSLNNTTTNGCLTESDMKAKPCIALLTIGVTLAACHPTPSNTHPENDTGQKDIIAPIALPSNESASIIVLDPATGEPATDPDILNLGTAQLLSPPLPRTPADELQQIVHDNGTVTLVLDETYHSPLMATLDCNGVIRTIHSENKADITEDCSTDVKGDAK